MNLFKKISATFIVLVCVAALFISFFGIHTIYGEVTTVVINSFDRVPRGFGFDKDIKMFFRYNNSAETTDKEKALTVIKQRLNLSGAVEHKVYPFNDNTGFMVEFPINSNNTIDLSVIDKVLSKDYKIEFRKGREVDEEGKPTGISKEAFLTNEHISSAIPGADSYMGTALYFITLNFNGKGEEVLKKACEELIQSGESTEFSIWMDDELLSAREVSSINSYSYLSFNSMKGFTVEEIRPIVIGLTTGRTGISSTREVVFSEINSGFAGDNNFKLIQYTYAAGLVLAFVFLCIKRRIYGMVSFISMSGSLGFTMFVHTNFMGNVLANHITLASFMAYFVLIIVSFELIMRESALIAEEMKSSTISKAVSLGFSKNIFISSIIYCFMFLSGLILSDAFNRNGGVFSSVMKLFIKNYQSETITGIGKFGYILMIGSAFGLIFNVLINRYLIKAVASLTYKDNSKFIGGKADE
ncbi:MAG: hypothetical protein GX222_07725 [Ruminococcaceae bacterium]|nr:hypothetical protein [Oscillospiraceae bacterium]